MIEIFSGATADEIWCKATNELMSKDSKRLQQSQKGLTLEILHAALSLTDPRQRWVISREPTINPAFAIVEVVWMLNGRNDAPFLNYWNSQYSKHAGAGSTYYGAYGFRLKHHLSLDQLERAYQVLSNDPDSRQVVLQLWDSTTDLPQVDGKPRSQDIPCNVLSMIKVRDGRLEWTQIMRSNDIFLGLPYNFVQFTTLQEVMAGWLGLDLGSYNHYSDSLHVYEDKMEFLKNTTPIHSPRNPDSLAMSKNDSDVIFKEFANRTELLKSESISEHQLLNLSEWKDAPIAYQNLFSVVAAEGARKRKWNSLVIEIIAHCANPLLTQLWNRWASTKEYKIVVEGCN